MEGQQPAVCRTGNRRLRLNGEFLVEKAAADVFFNDLKAIGALLAAAGPKA